MSSLEANNRKRTMRPARILLTLLVICSGCAINNSAETIEIRYIPQPGASLIAGAGQVSISTMDNRPGDHAQFSRKWHSLYPINAPILSDRPAGDIVQQALTEELRHRGFSTGQGGSSVTVTIRQFTAEFTAGTFGLNANAVVSFAVEVRNREGAQIYSRTITGKGLEPSNQVLNGRNARNAIEPALTDAMGDLMNDPSFFQALAMAVPAAK